MAYELLIRNISVSYSILLIGSIPLIGIPLIGIPLIGIPLTDIPLTGIPLK